MTELLHSSPTTQQLTAPLPTHRMKEFMSPSYSDCTTTDTQSHTHTLRRFCELAWISEFLLQLGGSLKTPDVRMTPNKVKG